MDDKKNEEPREAPKEPPSPEAAKKAYLTDLIDKLNRSAFERYMDRRLDKANHEPPVG